ncbi:MAG: flavocytochrome c [Burkholderiaceae bacterium]
MQRRNFLIMGSSAMLLPAMSQAAARRESCDIVVVGAGGAGLAAAVTAADLGAKVVVLEKMPVIGGNTQLAAGGMNAAGTQLQGQKEVKDDWRSMYADTMKGGRDHNDPALVEIMTRGSSDAVDWLTAIGGEFPNLKRSGGASAVRTHQPAGGHAFGPYVTRVLYAAALQRGITVRTRSRVVELVKGANGAAAGVVVQDARGVPYTIDAKAVIIASGGYGSNAERVAKYRPDFARFTSTGQPGTTGDGQELVQGLGGDVYDLDLIQIHPTQAVGSKTLISETVRGAGAILVNREGRRFVDEVTTRDRASAAVLKQTGRSAFLIFDHGVRTSMKMMDGYDHLGLIKSGATAAALAQKIGVDGQGLAATIAAYNRYQADKKDAEFGRADMPRPLVAADFHAIEVQPGIHFTMGGVRIDPRTRVLRADRSVVKGLYAAGEVTSGVHGKNRLGGNSMTALFTFGPIAAREAVAYIQA